MSISHKEYLKVFDYIKNVDIVELVDLLDDTGRLYEVESHLNKNISMGPGIMSTFSIGPDVVADHSTYSAAIIGFQKEKRASAIFKLSKYLKVGVLDAKKRLQLEGKPIELYKEEYDPSIYDELVESLESCGLKIITKSSKVDFTEWLSYYSEETRKAILFHLDFFKKWA